MTREEANNIARGITDKIEATTDIDDWAEFWGFTRDDYEEFLDVAIKALEQITDLKEAYNKGYKDGQDALAFHLELCKEEGSIIPIPNGATRRDLHKLVFGIDVPELSSEKFRCAWEKGCSNCKHKDNINCDMVWWNSPYEKGGAE